MITARTVATSRWTFAVLFVASLTATWLFLAHLHPGTAGAQLNGDVNLDGHVNSIDASIILQYDAGLIGSIRQKPTPTPVTTPTPIVTPTPLATPTPTPTPCPPGCILYEADWSHEANGWGEIFGWRWLNGQLLNDGTNGSNQNWIPAPYEPGAHNVRNYAVEAEIQLVRVNIGCTLFRYGIVLRENYEAGVGHASCSGSSVEVRTIAGNSIATHAFEPGGDWHTYRIEVQGNTLTFLVDGVQLLVATDNRYLDGGRVGLWSAGDQIAVRSFKVIAL